MWLTTSCYRRDDGVYFSLDAGGEIGRVAKVESILADDFFERSLPDTEQGRVGVSEIAVQVKGAYEIRDIESTTSRT